MPKKYRTFMQKNQRARTQAVARKRGLVYKSPPTPKSPSRRRAKTVKKRVSPLESLSRGRRNRGKDRRRSAKKRKSSDRMVDAPSRRSQRSSARRFADVVEQNLEFDRQQAAERQRKRSLKRQNKKDVDELTDMFSRF